MKSMQHGNTGRLVATTLCAALAIPMFASAAPAPGPVPPAANQQLARDVLRELVEIRSVHDVGTQATAAAIAARLLANGFSADEVQVVANEKYPHQVNVVARLKGRGAGKPVMWIGHMDVVEARPEDWSLPPFTFTEKDG
jgi:acetylornithine deacetylase/succinyl-diaminopimelate desuccinylase-like protein